MPFVDPLVLAFFLTRKTKLTLRPCVYSQRECPQTTRVTLYTTAVRTDATAGWGVLLPNLMHLGRWCSNIQAFVPIVIMVVVVVAIALGIMVVMGVEFGGGVPGPAV